MLPDTLYSAMVQFSGVRSLKLVTLTVNNKCNLSCPHCYLNYKGKNNFVSEEIIHRILESNCEHVAIVGKEPLVSLDEAKKTYSLIKRVKDCGKRVSLITNGLGLDFLPDQAAEMIDFIDISFDGGPNTYQNYRGPSYKMITEKLDRCVKRGFPHIRALCVLNSSTIHAIDDMLAITKLPGIDMLMFSPYIPTNNDGINSVTSPSIKETLGKLSQHREFLSTDKALFLIAKHELTMIGWHEQRFYEYMKNQELRKRTRYIEVDPLELGIIRITYDGFVMTPLDSLHPSDYCRLGIEIDSIGESTLDDIYVQMQSTVHN